MTVKKVKKQIAKNLLADVIGQAIEAYKIDEGLAYDKGVPYDIGGLTLHVCHAGNSNRAYLKAIQERAEDYKLLVKKHGENSKESKAASQRMMAEVFTDSVIVGVSIGGQKQLWNSEAKRQIQDMLCAIPEKFDELVVFSSQIDNYRAAIRKDSEKN